LTAVAEYGDKGDKHLTFLKSRSERFRAFTRGSAPKNLSRLKSEFDCTEVGAPISKGLHSYTKVWAFHSKRFNHQSRRLRLVKLFNTRSARQRPVWPLLQSRLPGPSWRDWPDPSKCSRCMLPNSASASRSSQARCWCCRGRQHLTESFQAAGLWEYREL
jgi:hypothetical protein